MNPKKEYDMLKSQIADSKASYLKHSSNHTPQVNVLFKMGYPFFLYIEEKVCQKKKDDHVQLTNLMDFKWC
jgi:hypothetical protein